MYGGFNVGWSRSELRTTDVNGFAALATPGTVTTLHHNGAFGGLDVGYNWQMNSIVFGLEADFGWMGLGQRGLIVGTTSSTTVGIKNGAYGDATARLGIATNNMLWYLKGGWAAYDGNRTFSTTAGFTAGNINTFNGWTGGGGVEFRLSQNWTGKLEYLHFDFGHQNFVLTPAGWPFREKLTADTLKVGVNYLFGH